MPTLSTLSTSTATITSNDPKGRKATDLFRAAYDKAGLVDDKAQGLNENPEFPVALLEVIKKLSITDRFASEEVKSNYAYPPEYKGLKPILEQVCVLKLAFPQLDITATLEFVLNVLPTLRLSAGAEGWSAIPRWQKIAAAYGEALEQVFRMIASRRNFTNYREGKLGPDHLREGARLAHALDLIAETQKGDILIVPVQCGMLHRGRSVRRAREVIARNPIEFGLGAFAGGCMALTHPERYIRYEELDTDFPGDEYDPGADGDFSRAPVLGFGGGRLGFGSRRVDGAAAGCGSVSGFLPQ